MTSCRSDPVRTGREANPEPAFQSPSKRNSPLPVRVRPRPGRSSWRSTSTSPAASSPSSGSGESNLVNLTCGSPYYNPHIQRPALFPPSDGYQPPEDPLAGVARQIAAAARLKSSFPDRVFVGSGYSYLQEYLPHVAQAAVRSGAVDFVGLGRMVLSYPDLPHDLLYGGGELARKQICRTFSDCTTAPRNGMVSGCFPLDDFYKNSEDRAAAQGADSPELTGNSAGSGEDFRQGGGGS